MSGQVVRHNPDRSDRADTPIYRVSACPGRMTSNLSLKGKGKMSGSVNKVILVGNLGRDPESRSFQNGGKVVNLRIATSESWKDKQTGERKEKTEWHSVAIFNEGLANVAERFLRKGSKVYIEGQLQTRKWQDQSGVDKYSTEVVLQGFGGVLTMLDGPNGGGERQGRVEGADNRTPAQALKETRKVYDDLDDDCPF